MDPLRLNTATDEMNWNGSEPIPERPRVVPPAPAPPACHPPCSVPLECASTMQYTASVVAEAGKAVKDAAAAVSEAALASRHAAQLSTQVVTSKSGNQRPCIDGQAAQDDSPAGKAGTGFGGGHKGSGCWFRRNLSISGGDRDRDWANIDKFLARAAFGASAIILLSILTSSPVPARGESNQGQSPSNSAPAGGSHCGHGGHCWARHHHSH